jgi:succinate dehydrogenase/fumarate reductase flavoprotein subunit
MKTSLEGLWAIGDTSYAGSSVAGAMCSPPGIAPGSGIMFAVISGGWAGVSASGYAAGTSSQDSITTSEIQQAEETAFSALRRARGSLPGEIIAELQDVMAPIKYNLRRRKDRLEQALKIIERLKTLLPGLKATDFHYLSKCHEVKSMVLCAELTYRAALLREESRGSHFREDFPARDDNNWLKWVIIKQQQGKMNLTTLSVPVEKYKIRPVK